MSGHLRPLPAWAAVLFAVMFLLDAYAAAGTTLALLNELAAVGFLAYASWEWSRETRRDKADT